MFEKIVALLTALVAALEANTAAHSGKAAPAAAPAKGGKKTETAPTTTTSVAAPSVNDVRTAAAAYLAAQTDKALQSKYVAELNKKYGTTKISEVAEDKRAEVIAAFNAEIARLAAAPAAGDDGI